MLKKNNYFVSNNVAYLCFIKEITFFKNCCLGYDNDYQSKSKGSILTRKNNTMPIWGNERTMNLNTLILTNIQSSHYFKGNHQKYITNKLLNIQICECCILFNFLYRLLKIWCTVLTYIGYFYSLNNLICYIILVNLYELKTYHEVIDEIYYKVQHLEPWEKGSRKTSGQTGMCGGVRF